MAENFDYHNFDKLEVTARTAKEKDIVSHYALFGWEELERTKDKKVLDIAHITFIRPHKIENKDKLQLLQIYYENYMNELCEYEKYRHTGSAVYVISAILSVLILSAIGVILFFASSSIMKILAGLVILVSFVLMLCALLNNKNIRKNEKESYKKRYTNLKSKIECVLNDARYLTGGENAQK